MPLGAWILNILGYIFTLIMFFATMLGDPSEDEIDPLVIGSIILIIYLTLIIITLIMFRKVGILSAVVGKESIIILSRKESMRKDAKDFIQEVHSLTPILKSKASVGLGLVKRKRFISICALILVIIFIVLFAIIVMLIS